MKLDRRIALVTVSFLIIGAGCESSGSTAVVVNPPHAAAVVAVPTPTVATVQSNFPALTQVFSSLTEQGYSMKYPTGWTADNKTDAFIVLFGSPDEKNEFYSATVNVQHVKGDGKSVESAMAMQQAGLHKQMEGAPHGRVVSSKTLTFVDGAGNKVPAIEERYEYELNGTAFKQWQFIVGTRATSIYLWAFTDLASDFDKHQGIGESMLKTWTFAVNNK